MKKIDQQLARATAIGAKKLKGWREEDHAGERMLLELSRQKSD